MPLLSLLCILCTLLEGPSSGRNSINIFLICIELPVPVFLQKTALLAPTSLETLEQMPTLFYFCLPFILLVRSYRNFLYISYPIFLVSVHSPWILPIPPVPTVSLQPSVLVSSFESPQYFGYIFQMPCIRFIFMFCLISIIFCKFESQWFKIFALPVLPVWSWPSNPILNKHQFQFYEMGKKIWPISQGNSYNHLLCESILQTIKFYEPVN